MSTVNARTSGVASVFPAASTARTRTVYAPSASAVNDTGELQFVKAPVAAPALQPALEPCAALRRREREARCGVADDARRAYGDRRVGLDRVDLHTHLHRRRDVAGRVARANLVGVHAVCDGGECEDPAAALVDACAAPGDPRPRRRGRRRPLPAARERDLRLTLDTPVCGRAHDRRRGCGGVDDERPARGRRIGLPARSTARTSRVYSPSASARKVSGEAHGAKAPLSSPEPSRRHSKLTSGSVEEKVKVGVLSWVVAGGPPSMLVAPLVCLTLEGHRGGHGAMMRQAPRARRISCRPISHRRSSITHSKLANLLWRASVRVGVQSPPADGQSNAVSSAQVARGRVRHGTTKFKPTEESITMPKIGRPMKSSEIRNT